MKIIVKYKCKLCGKENVEHSFKIEQAEGYDIDIDRSVESIVRNIQNVPHYCDNKRIGVTEPYEVIKEE